MGPSSSITIEIGDESKPFLKNVSSGGLGKGRYAKLASASQNRSKHNKERNLALEEIGLVSSNEYFLPNDDEESMDISEHEEYGE